MTQGRERLVILNADDFGASTAINAAVVRAYWEGVLTSASLMAGGAAFEEAVELARAMPGLAVGLHIVAAGGPAVLPPSEIQAIADARGQLDDNPLRAGLRYVFSPAARAALHRELTAQFARFAETGLPLSHVDGHMHMHMHPTVFGIALPLAQKHGAAGWRLPRDNLALALRYRANAWPTKVRWALALGLLSAWARRRLVRTGLIVADRVYGLFQSGAMTEDYVCLILRQLPAGLTELYFHPSLGEQDEPLGPNRGDLETLLSQKVQHTLEERDIVRVSYATRRGGGR